MSQVMSQVMFEGMNCLPNLSAALASKGVPDDVSRLLGGYLDEGSLSNWRCTSRAAFLEVDAGVMQEVGAEKIATPVTALTGSAWFQKQSELYKCVNCGAYERPASVATTALNLDMDEAQDLQLCAFCYKHDENSAMCGACDYVTSSSSGETCTTCSTFLCFECTSNCVCCYAVRCSDCLRTSLCDECGTLWRNI